MPVYLKSMDDTLNHKAVKLYRDTFLLTPNRGFRKDIIATVKDLELWREVLSSWRYLKKGKWKQMNPLNLKGMFQEYERREKKRTPATGRPRVEFGGLRESSRVGISEWRHRSMSEVRQDSGVHAGRSHKTFDEIVSAALRTKD